MTARSGKTWSAASVIGGMEASAQPLRAPRSGRVMRTIQAGPLAGLIVLAKALRKLFRSPAVPDPIADFAAYLFLFPIFTAGPVERFDNFLAKRETQWRSQFAVEASTHQ